jgi:hypothetical protein
MLKPIYAACDDRVAIWSQLIQHADREHERGVRAVAMKRLDIATYHFASHQAKVDATAATIACVGQHWLLTP